MKNISIIKSNTLRTAAAMMLGAACQLSAFAFSGVILDRNGVPVADAMIRVKDGQASFVTGEDGKFNFDLPLQTTLIVSAPGYKATEFNVGALKRTKDKENVKIVLSDLYIPVKATLPGLYGPVDAASYIGSASTVYTDEINRTMGSTIIPGLVGKMAGLNITQFRGWRERATTRNGSQGFLVFNPTMGMSIGSDNSEYNIYSRGMKPIVYVDGIEREFFSLDPDMVESVSIQKDALSTMFNGMRSSRPVLLITTKNPLSQGAHVSFTARFGFSNPVSKPKPLSTSQYAYLLNEALTNDGRTPIYDRDDYYAYLNNQNPYLYPNVNWFETAARNHAFSQYYNLNVNGGNNFAQYFVNAGFYYENGMFRSLNDSYSTKLTAKRYSIDSKVKMHITRDFTADISLLARLEEGNQPSGSGSGYSDILLDIYRTPFNAYPIYNPNGTWGGDASFTQNLYAKVSQQGYITDATRDLLAMVNLNYDFDRYVKGLSVYALGSVSVQSRSATFRTATEPVFHYGISTDGNPAYHRYGNIKPMENDYRAVGTYQQLWGKIGVDYKRQFGLNSFNASVSADTRQDINSYDLPSLPSNILQNLGWDYDKKYFAQVAVTESYYNRYAKGKRWGAFFAAGLGWDMARENFMQQARGWLDMLKLRLVYGRTGNGVDNTGYYTYYQTYSQSGNSGYVWGTTYNNSIKFTYANSPMANPNLTWEKADKWDAGIDASFFGSRLSLQADYYHDRYFDILQERGKSIGLLGTSYPAENIGKQLREGGEITLTWQDKAGADYNYFVTANWNIERSKVLFMDEQKQPYDYLQHTGNAVGAIYGLKAVGFFNSMDEIANSAVMEGYDNIQPGDIKYLDVNGDKVIDEFDQVVIGGNKPLQYFGLNLGFEWKGLEFSMDWQGVYNRDIYITDRNLVEGFQTYGQTYGQAYDLIIGRWTPETAGTAILPRLSAGGNNYNMGGDYNSSFWVKNGNFIRCRNIYLAYTLPQTFCRNFLGGVRPKIFVNVQNLISFTGCDWVDPEVSYTSYPLQRTWSFGINFNF